MKVTREHNQIIIRPGDGTVYHVYGPNREEYAMEIANSLGSEDPGYVEALLKRADEAVTEEYGEEPDPELDEAKEQYWADRIMQERLADL